VKGVAPITGCDVMPPLRPRAKKTTRAARALAPARYDGGRWQSLNAFVDATMRSLTGAEAKVWLLLFRDTKPSGLVRASDAELGRRAGIAARSVRRARTRLKRLGLLEVIRRGGLFTGPSEYRVRSLVADTNGRSHEDKDGHGPRTPVSYIPQRDQKGCPDPFGSGTLKKKRAASRREVARP